MTTQDFDNQKWRAGIRAIYRGQVYPVAAVDFGERLLGLYGVASGAAPDEILWVRCENVTLIDSQIAGAQVAPSHQPTS